MNDQESLHYSLARLWRHISERRRWQLGFLLILMLISSCAEIVSIGSVMPLLSVLVEPNRVFDNPSLKIFFKTMGFTSTNQLLLPITLCFSIAALAAGGFRLLLLWASTRLSFSMGADMSISIYQRTLHQPYIVHIKRNSSEVISGISTKANSTIFFIISPLLTLISSCVMLVLISTVLIFLDPFLSITIFGGFGLIYFFIISLTRRKLLRDGKRAAIETNMLIKTLQEGLGGIRDILIDGAQEIHCAIYRRVDLSLRRAQGDTVFIGASPRYLVETIGVVFLAFIAYSLSIKGNTLVGMIPILGVLALGTQRLLPVVQQAYGSWTHLQSGKAMLEDTLSLLEQPYPKNAGDRNASPLKFEEKLKLSSVSYGYEKEGPLILSNISMEIKKGSIIGIVGTTGSGKSTLLDVIMGLLTPSSGAMEIDAIPVDEMNLRNWQANIAHVPQTIFLKDATIAENIAFGVNADQIDHELVKSSAKIAQIDGDIEALSKKYMTLAGEGGVRLSGGQRQRIGIARAIYKKAEFIILDEATSALDDETEKKVMQSITSMRENITLLIVAHRISTLEKCSEIVILKNGTISKISSFNEL
jgi:ATP-binding cassette subfamily B protein